MSARECTCPSWFHVADDDDDRENGGHEHRDAGDGCTALGCACEYNSAVSAADDAARLLAILPQTRFECEESVMERTFQERAVALELPESGVVDVPFEPRFGDMSREELLAIARRYHWMLADVEAFAEGSETPWGGHALTIRSVERDDADATYVNMFGSAKLDAETLYPFVIGVQS